MLRSLFTRQANSRVSLGLIVLAACLAAWSFQDLGLARKDFYNNLLAPVRLLVQGENPYNTTPLGTELPPVWLAPAIGLFFPLAWLPDKIAGQFWYFWSLTALALLVILSLQKTASIPAVVIAGLTAFFFPPVVNHVALGQFSITAALCCLLAALCMERKQDWPAAFLLALALTKPQIAFLAVTGLGFHAFHRDGFPGLLRFVLRLFLAGLVLSLPAFIVYPGWIGDWLANLRQNQTWLHPSLFTVLKQWAGNRAFHLWGVVIAIGVEGCWLLWRRLSPREAMIWTLGLTLIITPYIWSWDFVLLLPLWVWGLSGADGKRAAFLLLVYLAGWAGMAAIQLSPDYNNIRFWWVPWLFLGALLTVELRWTVFSRRQG